MNGISIPTTVVVVLLAASLTTALQPPNVSVTLDDSGGFKVMLSGVEWLRSGPVGIRDGGQWWASDSKDKYLLKVEKHLTDKGEDVFGSFDSDVYVWKAYSDENTPTNVQVKTTINVYHKEPVAYFSIEYTTGLSKASIPDTNDHTLSSFPSFVLEETDMKRASLTWARGMTDSIEIAEWTAEKGVYGKVDGGFPLVVFNADMDTAMVLSPATTFMSATQYSFKDENTNNTVITFGPMSSIDEIPAGYTYSTILVAGNNVTGTMRKFGELLRRMYSKDLHIRRNDFCINYLGYWTDNGACYYYTTGSTYTNYEDLLVAVKKDADDNGLPFRYVQLDSWWYYKGPHDGVKNWTAVPSVFPNGIEAVVNKTGWRIVGHNRWWSHDTDYQNKFKFIVEDSVALPVDPKFWDYLIKSSQIEWSLIVYEQDWLDVQYPKTKALQTTLDLGEVWLKQMGEAAQRYGVSVEYCMAWPRHVMQSVAIPAVTHTRASGDYQPSNSQWNIGDSSILTHSIGLAPFKDNFRTSSNQPDCKKFHNMTEGYPALETYVAVLSTGPVGPNDQIGTANKTLIMATCMMDGRILKPTHPAMSIDSTFVQRAFGSGGPAGQFAAAFAEIGRWTWYYILAAELTSPYSMSPTELPPSHSTFPATSFPKSIAFQYTFDKNITNMADFGSDMKLKVAECGKSDFQYWVIAPYFPNGLALLGELDKVTTVSEARFGPPVISGDEVSMAVNGVPTENVSVTFYDVNKKTTMNVACTISDSGTNQVRASSSGISCA